MAFKIGLVVVVVLGLFAVYVATRDGKFRYERSGVINAPASTVYPYIADLRKGNEWSPYMKKDPNMKIDFKGDGSSVGSVMSFDGNSQAGSGTIETLALQPNESASYKLTMLKPFNAENLVEYKLTPEGNGTRFTWIMSGNGGFMSKFMNVIIDCEKMIAGDFEKGIANLKALIEAKAPQN